MVAILLPFLIVLGVGISVGASERRAISLVGLLWVIPVGAMMMLNLAKPTFIPRWFSFLDPFFAAVLARGIVEISGGVRREASASVAAFAITWLLVLFSLPVLNHYYHDPDFHPYQWRQAATIVRERALPGDLMLYGHLQNRLAFTYYFTPHEEMELLPDRDYVTLGRSRAGSRASSSSSPPQATTGRSGRCSPRSADPIGWSRRGRFGRTVSAERRSFRLCTSSRRPRPTRQG